MMNELSYEYQLISRFYGEQVAKRTQVRLMNHIDEGLMILRKREAGKIAESAFCLHPLIQTDQYFERNLYILNDNNIDRTALCAAIEYRNIANQYLSWRIIDNISEIALSPLAEVNEMLIADKIQNYADFIIYHKKDHPRSAELDVYFQNWLSRLQIVNFNEWFAFLKRNKEHA